MIGVAIVALLGSQAPDAAVLQEIQRSHVESNTPPSADFTRLLQRDLDSHFKETRGKAVRVEYEMLRDGPTQSGVAYPKFYLWVRVHENGLLVDQGAVRVAAIDRKLFQVTDFVSERAIRAEPAGLVRVFPAPVCEKIKAKVGIRP